MKRLIAWILSLFTPAEYTWYEWDKSTHQHGLRRM